MPGLLRRGLGRGRLRAGRGGDFDLGWESPHAAWEVSGDSQMQEWGPQETIQKRDGDLGREQYLKP